MGSRQFDRQTIIDAMTNKSIKIMTADSSAVIATNGIERIVFFSPPNTVSRILNVQMKWDAIQAGGLTGTRTMYLDNYINANSGLGNFKAYSSDLYNYFIFDQGAFKTGESTAGVTFIPNDLAAVNTNVRGVSFDDKIGVSCAFSHNIPVGIGEPRHVILFVEQEVVAR